MIKYILFTLSFICCLQLTSLHSQEEEGFSGSVTYRLNKDLGVPIYQDFTLLFDQNISIMTAASKYKYKKVPENLTILKSDKTLSKLVGHTYINRNTDSIFSQGLVYKTPYYVKDKIEKTKWKLGTETKDISGFPCQNATGNFGGRRYKVWFTTAIPVSLGPWKLLGLPGLILYARDDTGSIEFIAKNVELGLPANTVQDKYDNIPKMGAVKSLREFVPLKDLEYLERHKASLARRPRQENTTTEVIPAGRTYKMQITYEWEKEEVVDKDK